MKLFAAVCIVMLTLAGVCYWPAVSGEFVWDDENLVVQNPYIRSPLLAGEAFRHWLQPGSNAPYYRPIQTLTMVVDYYFWNKNPVGYHLTNIALHAACGVLLFYLLRALLTQRTDRPATSGEQLWIPLTVAVIWIVHPIHNAAVAYVSGRADSLAFVFASAAWLLTLAAQGWSGGRRLVGFLAASFLMLVALCSKEIAAIWLALYFGHSIFSRRTTAANTLGRAAACVAILAVWLMMRHLPAEPALPAGAVATSIPQRIVLVARAIGDYAGLIVFPGELHMERLLWPELPISKTTLLTVPTDLGWLGWTGIVVLISAVGACVAPLKGQILRIGGVAWFTIAFFPISNAIPLNAQAAEHWIYLASVGALTFLAGAFLMIPQRFRKAALVTTVVWVAALAVRTNVRAADWSDPVRFYTQTIGATGGTARIYNNLGVVLQRKGRLDEAERVYRVGLKLFPGHPSLLFNFGNLLGTKGLKAEAEKYFAQSAAKASAAQAPGDDRVNARSKATQARVLIQKGQPEEAIKLLGDARQASGKRNWELDRAEAEALAELQRWSEARALVRSRIDHTWWDKDARSLLGRLLERTADLEQAEREWRMAAKLDVWDAEPWAALSRIYRDKGDFRTAAQYQREAVERTPDHVESRMILAAILKELGETEEAQEEFLKARYLQVGGRL